MSLLQKQVQSGFYVISRNHIIFQLYICWSDDLETLFPKSNGLCMTFRHTHFIVVGSYEKCDNLSVFYQSPTITPVHLYNTGGFCSWVTNHIHSEHTVRATSDSHGLWEPYKLLCCSSAFPFCLAASWVAWSRLRISCVLLGCYFLFLSRFPHL